MNAGVERNLLGNDFGARDATPGEIASNFGDKARARARRGRRGAAARIPLRRPRAALCAPTALFALPAPRLGPQHSLAAPGSLLIDHPP